MAEKGYNAEKKVTFEPEGYENNPFDLLDHTDRHQIEESDNEKVDDPVSMKADDEFARGEILPEIRDGDFEIASLENSSEDAGSSVDLSTVREDSLKAIQIEKRHIPEDGFRNNETQDNKEEYQISLEESDMVVEVPIVSEIDNKENGSSLKKAVLGVFKNFFQKFPSLFPSSGIADNDTVDRVLFYINAYLFRFVVLALSVATLIYSFFVLQSIDEIKEIGENARIRKEVQVENAKIEKNRDFSKFAEFLINGSPTKNGGHYPDTGYMQALRKSFPEKLESLSLNTFFEGWSSEFISFNGETYRVGNDIIKSIKKESESSVGGERVAEIAIKLSGDQKKINGFLSNMMFGNRLPKDVLSIQKKYKGDGIMDADLLIAIYLKSGNLPK